LPEDLIARRGGCLVRRMRPSVPQQVEPKPSANRETTLCGLVSPEFSLDADARY
jgi:hypothetical protein